MMLVDDVNVDGIDIGVGDYEMAEEDEDATDRAPPFTLMIRMPIFKLRHQLCSRGRVNLYFQKRGKNQKLL